MHLQKQPEKTPPVKLQRRQPGVEVPLEEVGRGGNVRRRKEARVLQVQVDFSCPLLLFPFSVPCDHLAPSPLSSDGLSPRCLPGAPARLHRVARLVSLLHSHFGPFASPPSCLPPPPRQKRGRRIWPSVLSGASQFESPGCCCDRRTANFRLWSLALGRRSLGAAAGNWTKKKGDEEVMLKRESWRRMPRRAGSGRRAGASLAGPVECWDGAWASSTCLRGRGCPD